MQYQHNAPIHHILLDNDGTLYREPENVKELHMQAGILAVQSFVPDLSQDEVRALIKESKASHKSSFGIFKHAPYDIDLNELRRTHYNELASMVDDSFINPEEAPNRGLAAARIAGINIHIGTHGNREWTKFSAQKNGDILTYFNDRTIFTKDESPDKKGKNQGHEFYRSMLDYIGVQAKSDLVIGRNCAMVEDTVENLIAAKELGMMTILIDANMTPENKPDYVDVVVSNIDDALQAPLRNNMKFDDPKRSARQGLEPPL